MNEENIQQAVLEIQACQAKISTLLGQNPSLAIRAEHVFKSLVNSLTASAMQATAMNENALKTKPIGLMFGKSFDLHEGASANIATPAQPLASYKERVEGLLTNISKLNDKDILATYTDLEIRGAAKLAQVHDYEGTKVDTTLVANIRKVIKDNRAKTIVQRQ